MSQGKVIQGPVLQPRHAKMELVLASRLRRFVEPRKESTVLTERSSNRPANLPGPGQKNVASRDQTAVAVRAERGHPTAIANAGHSNTTNNEQRPSAHQQR